MADQRWKYFQSGGSLISREYPNVAIQRRALHLEEKKEHSRPEIQEIQESTSHENEMVPETPVLFKDIQIHPQLFDVLQKLHFNVAKQVQAKALSFFSEDSYSYLKICASRKSGKTTAVLLCVINEILNDPLKKYNQVLILCPTVDLAELCYLSAQLLTKFIRLTPCLVVKGKSFNKNEKITENIIIATPDKAVEILPFIDFHRIRNVVFDDANYLKNPRRQLKGFSVICKKLSSRGRVIVTTDSECQILKNFIKEYDRFWVDIVVESIADYKNLKEVYVLHEEDEDRLDALVHFTSRLNQGQTVIFCETTESLNQLEKDLHSNNIGAVKLHGGFSPANRKNILEQFKKDEIRILITTEAFVRVLPSDHITTIINLEQLYDEALLLLKEYDKRKFLLNDKGTFVSFIEKQYEEFFFKKKTTYKGRNFFNNTEIMTVEEFKNL